MEEVEDVLQMCSTSWSHSSVERSDYVVFTLEGCRDYVTAMLNNALLTASPPAEVDRLVELHSIISLLLILWEASLERTAGGGRPRKYINIPLVCVLIYKIIPSLTRIQYQVPRTVV